MQESTIVIKGRKKALQEAYRRSLTSVHDYYCITGDELTKSYKPFIPLLHARISQRAGSTQIITNIEKETIPAVKELTEAGAQVKHIDISSLRRCVIYDDDAAYFSIVEEPLITHTAIDNVDQTEGEDLWVASTEYSVIQSAKKRYISDWENAIQYKDRIHQLETGIEPEFYKVITDSEKASQLIRDLTISVKREALLFLPNSKSLVRSDNLGIIDKLIETSQKGATVKIICPISEQNMNTVEKISRSQVQLLDGDTSNYGMYIVDGEKFFRAELKEPMADKFSEAAGLVIYSNRKTTVDSFKSVFELLWNERVLVEELKKADKMQKEFINITAHELRTPIQPILVVIDTLLSKKGNIENYEELLSMIRRNAKRLQRVTENILDVTRIESGSFGLKKELFDLNEVIMAVLAAYGSDIKKADQLKIILTSKESFYVEADKVRIAQVISNLLNNAMKFTQEGTITISCNRMNHGNEKHSAMFCMKDTGVGIHPEIYPKLFSKFASHSDGGIGLGLFLCKNIVNAQGGRIWAENNPDGKGSAFFFTLPLHHSSRDVKDRPQT
ncbi:MAG TPA: HAMP domain-containing sensor histidine kinase [Nitrososphaeraceae archaeon]|nr:HAMP domain-containing sensor histidine kinase [Nitrososphaeraceae archaeon]